jgi:predicted metal-dependent peptidase|tara:strand:- start:3911 stop:4999 length:1089 start_codon:yes stop_codon:yes gene_type:complete
MSDLEKAFSKAKIGIMSQHNSSFIGYILFSLHHSWDNTIPTACTNGKYLKINTDFFMSLSEPERIFLLAHESWHVAFSHIVRKGERDHLRWNKAGDYVINIMLRDAGYAMILGGLIDNKYRDWSTAQVYDDLPDSSDDDEFDSDIGEPEDTEEFDEQIKEIILSAVTQAGMSNESGSIPGEIQREVNKLTNPKLDWRTILQNYMSTFAKNDYSFRKPNRRFFPNYHLPSLYSEDTGEIAIAIDTSGSVSKEEFTAFLCEINSIKENLNPKLTTIIDFDTRVRKVHSLTEDENIGDIKFHGGGGTNLDCVFDYYGKNKPTVLIVFSDLHCKRIVEDPKYPVIWIVVNNSRATTNFGTQIHYTI